MLVAVAGAWRGPALPKPARAVTHMALAAPPRGRAWGDTGTEGLSGSALCRVPWEEGGFLRSVTGVSTLGPEGSRVGHRDALA